MRKAPLLMLIIFPLILLGAGLILCHDPFIAKIAKNIAPQKEWDLPQLSPEETSLLKKSLSQPFKYLKGGSQAYSFESEDGQLIIKFLKGKHLKPKTWVKFLPLPLPPSLKQYRFRKVEKREERLQKIFESYKAAFEELKEEGGLLFVQLNPSKLFSEPLQLFDKLGNKHHLDLNKIPFVLQKKAELLKRRLERLAHFEDSMGLEKARQAILNLVSLCCQKHFIDLDGGISHNYGFVGDQAMQIDFGRVIKVSPQETLNKEKELEQVKNRLDALIFKAQKL